MNTTVTSAPPTHVETEQRVTMGLIGIPVSAAQDIQVQIHYIHITSLSRDKISLAF